MTADNDSLWNWHPLAKYCTTVWEKLHFKRLEVGEMTFRVTQGHCHQKCHCSIDHITSKVATSSNYDDILHCFRDNTTCLLVVKTGPLISVSALCSLQCFGTDGWWQEEHSTRKNRVPLIPEVFIWNRWHRKTQGRTGWLRFTWTNGC